MSRAQTVEIERPPQIDWTKTTDTELVITLCGCTKTLNQCSPAPSFTEINEAIQRGQQIITVMSARPALATGLRSVGARFEESVAKHA